MLRTQLSQSSHEKIYQDKEFKTFSCSRINAKVDLRLENHFPLALTVLYILYLIPISVFKLFAELVKAMCTQVSPKAPPAPRPWYPEGWPVSEGAIWNKLQLPR